jgi:phage/plasmid primase-like uncharacterized protein
MGYMTFAEQIASHLQFLQKAGHAVINLTIDSEEFLRSQAEGEVGKYAYKTVSRQLNNGMTGLMTWCRSEGGRISNHRTYGYGSQEAKYNLNLSGKSSHDISREYSNEKEGCDIDIKKIQKFWELSSTCGESDYLTRKGVKAHHIRFRENCYGRVAVIPMRNIQGQLRGYQILNADGSKAFAKGIRLNGLFHNLTDLSDNVPIGIAESYVTAATCHDLLPMPTVTAFTGDNLEHVAAALRERYPNSPLVIFADNDRHLRENKGMVCAKKAIEKAKGNGIILKPRFRNSLKVRDYSDWNDLVREIGSWATYKQILIETVKQTQDGRILTHYI